MRSSVTQHMKEAICPGQKLDSLPILLFALPCCRAAYSCPWGPHLIQGAGKHIKSMPLLHQLGSQAVVELACLLVVLGSFLGQVFVRSAGQYLGNCVRQQQHTHKFINQAMRDLP